MNGIRQGMHPASGLVQTPNSMLSIGNPPFMQNPAHMGQPSLSQGMGVPQNMNPSNPPMGILSGGPVPPNVTPRYSMQPNPMLQQQQRPTVMRQGQNPPQLNPAGNPSQVSHMQHLQNVQFPGSNMMPQPPGANNQVRRVQSQPMMGGVPTQMGGMPSTAGGNMGMPMGMGMQPNLPPQMRQPPHPNQQNARMQQQQALMQQVGMRDQPPNQVMPQGMPRAPPTPNAVMNSLQPATLASMPHPGAMQPPNQQNTFTNGGPMSSQQPQISSSPRPPQNHTPSMSMGTPGPSHTPNGNRTRMTPDNSFIGYPGSQFPPNPARMSNSNQSNYPFVPSPTPPMPMDINPTSPGMMHTPQGPPSRSFSAQPYDMMSSAPLDIYSPSFGMPPPPAVPHPRPPSHANHHPPPQQQPPNQQQQPPSSQQQHQSHHQSPQHSDQMNSHPQRPQSQPQQGPGRPPSQAATPTPRSAQMALPPSGLQVPLTALGRIPPAQQTQGPPVPSMPPIAPRPPPVLSNVPPPPPPLGSAGPMPGDATQAGAARAAALATGTSHGVMRLLQFSGVLSGDSSKTQKFQLHFWNEVVKDYFTPKAVMKLTLWRDNLRTEAKPFEIGVPILPRFFLVTTQSGVKSMTLSLDGARERPHPQLPGRSVVECISAIWTYKYTNGYTVMLKGPLTLTAMMTQITPPGNSQAAQFIWKFDDFNFDANAHEKFISLEHILGNRMIDRTMPSNFAPTMPGMSSQAQIQQHQIEEDKRCEEPRVLIDHGSIPGEPVNAFGIPQATMRCLELAESVSSMADLIIFANDTKLGPIDALKGYANKIRESQALGPMQQPMNPITQNNTNNNNNNTSLGPPYLSYPSSTAIGHTPAVTLYSSAPASITNPQPPNPPSSMNSPQNTSSSSSVNSPEKQLKTIPQQQQAPTPSQSGPASSPAVSSSGTTNNTPAMANTSLKRKQAGDASSPTVGNSEQQPVKRGARKKGRTGTG